MPNAIHELWPPLSLIRSAFAQADDGGAVPGSASPSSFPPSAPASASAPAPAVVAMPGGADAAAAPARAAPQRDANLLLPLTELAQRREAVARRAFPARWAPGRLVSVLHRGRLLGVMLDKAVEGEGGPLWQGWLAASEADWASAYDVLLEPQDEPFEPMFGLIQTWNAITLRPTPQLCARVQGEVSATRLAALRAVHEEWVTQVPLAIEPEPGRIALRTTAGVFSVLSGTPLGPQDPRAEYQALYREVALPLAVPVQAAMRAPGDGLAARVGAGASREASPSSSSTVSSSRGAPLKPRGPGFWQRLGDWFAADRWVRPAFALLALVVVVQNTGWLTPPEDEEEVRFRSAPPVSARVPLPELLVRWKADARVEETNLLLQTADAELSGGPDAEGRWRVRVSDAVGGLALLAASPLVQSVAPLEGSAPP